jgi:hypothetical protein
MILDRTYLLGQLGFTSGTQRLTLILLNTAGEKGWAGFGLPFLFMKYTPCEFDDYIHCEEYWDLDDERNNYRTKCNTRKNPEVGKKLFGAKGSSRRKTKKKTILRERMSKAWIRSQQFRDRTSETSSTERHAVNFFE